MARPSTQRLTALTAIIGASAVARAHQGAPGHIHPELGPAQQLLHAAANWAPVVVLAVIVACALRHALRRRA